MQNNFKSLLWNAVFVLVLLSICGLVYLSGKRIDYSWNWERVLPYIATNAASSITAPVDGNIILDENNQLALESIHGDIVLELSQYKSVDVYEGDLIFEGDTLATIKEWRSGPILDGVVTTIKISLWSLIIALALGLVVGLMRISSNLALKKLALVYVEVIRGTPLLVQIFIVYFFIGTVLDLERFTAGVIALSVFTAAYVAEIVRSGIQSIPRGQMEAARSLGMNYPKAMIYVILPQAFKQTLPPLAGQFINLIKDSSLVSVISITDLTKAGREVVSGSFAPFEVWFTVAALYLLLTSTLSWAIQTLEKKLAASD
ncbi:MULTISPECIES: amino acid ABC transporter permease [Vibrio]|uniref:amino acid ABC transporter permease n=1 Tax=Vibrio TaxID=662 RepID=UPI00045F2A84|nr:MULTISPECIES: amino acid ABC transporter permease [Vibrio]MDW2260682.1 amino acid ABC transporter permease [Vibrio sp. 1409]MDW2297772.1 amino acid ABC transporter permease [Vibrio sp. 1404]GAK15912.1 LOW QUALITY PROTEIN: amino acid ABC transporter, permease protein [Vibrio sp. JCM 19053]AVF74551.1 amino acid ABC transporter permease [Vibrio alginolyticus]EIK0773552.1 amino acid ABC transporter permease [Vibrio alginolyticus]